MRGPRPPQPHMNRIWDAAQAVGRTDVTDVIEAALTNLRTEVRMFPDFSAHHVTAALIEAGLIDPEGGGVGHGD